MANEKVYLSSQLCCLLPALSVKVFNYIILWQGQNGRVKYYEHQFSKMLHLSKDEIEVAIQTLIDYHLLSVQTEEEVIWLIINKEEIKKSFNLEIAKVKDIPAFKLNTTVTWNKPQTKQSTSIDGMSDDEMKRMILMLSAKLKEKEEVKQMTQASTSDDLPW